MRDYFNSTSTTPLHLIITGTAGTGKSYLIQCLRLLLGDALKVAAPTGVASFIIDGSTLHSLLHLPTRGEFKELEGNHLLELQQVMSTIKYLIIDEMSMVPPSMTSLPPPCSGGVWWMLHPTVWRLWPTTTSH